MTQLQLATAAAEANDHAAEANDHAGGAGVPAERGREVSAWEGRIGAWERGVDAPSPQRVPALSHALGLDPLALFDVDPQAPPFSALRMAAGLTLQSLARSTGLSYTSLHRMVRGVSQMPNGAARGIADALHVSVEELRASVERERSS